MTILPTKYNHAEAISYVFIFIVMQNGYVAHTFKVGARREVHHQPTAQLLLPIVDDCLG